MLGTDVKEQLKILFSDINSQIALNVFNCEHESQEELLELLSDISNLSNKVKLNKLSENTSVPSFYLTKNNKKTGISFKGIPNGHEFTSLILAILNIDGKGKLPDESLQKRIGNLAGPIKLKTYISLTCENCPDVVQALNQMCLFHEDFSHEMIDGAMTQDEVELLKIQGVPSLVKDHQLLHSGKASFLDLLKTLEKTFGTKNHNQQNIQINLGNYEVVIVGGGPAGVSAAIYAARKGLKTVMVVERFGGQVQDTKGIENFVATLYTEGPKLAAQLKEHIEHYNIKLFEHRKVLSVDAVKKVLHLESGEYIHYQAMIVTTGAKWRELGIPGEKEYIGRGVAFCPHCDGPSFKDKKVAVIGGGNSGIEAAIDLSQIVKEVVVLEFMDQLKADKVLVDKMNSIANISFKTSIKTKKVIGNGEKVVALEYENRTNQKVEVLELDGIFVQIGLSPNSQFLKNIVELTQHGEIIVDQKGRTSNAAIFAAGDVTNIPYKQIIIAMGEGAKTALSVFEALKLN